MIKINDKIFQIDTKNSSLVMQVTKFGHLELLHYGAKINSKDYKALLQKRSLLLVNSLYPQDDHTYGIDDMAFAYSVAGRGDSRTEALRLHSQNGECYEFLYDCYAINEIPQYNEFAHSRQHDCALKLSFCDKPNNLILDLWFLVYQNCDVITRFSKLTNLSSAKVDIQAIMSAQFDLSNYGYKLATFDGAWARERQLNVKEINNSSFVISSRCGMSSAEHNPLFMIMADNCALNHGDCYGFNLVYSGNHEIRVESDYMGRIRVQNGILRDGFLYSLGAGQSFVTPESVATYSPLGSNGASINLSNFTAEHIVRNNSLPPIMLNSWEAMYFDISEEKILDIANSAKQIGFEALVVDDGWFGDRNDDKTSLGDWYPNPKKFPQGMRAIGEKLHAMGLMFGLWVEPEMISKKSALYAKHPDWAVCNNLASPIVGRNQYLLDLTNSSAQNYLVDTLTKLVVDNNIDYLKWDFNRRFAECGINSNSGMFYYDYIQGLYYVLYHLNKNCPKLIIEGCASGGGRYDLGMLCFCPIVWASDNTDTYSRMHIQEGTGYGYPISTEICHISVTPNHQTQRCSDLETRVAVASFGVMGAQMDTRRLSQEDKEELSQAIAEYKNQRTWGNLLTYRLQDGFTHNEFIWQAISQDKANGKLLIYRKRFNPLNNIHPIRLCGLKQDAVYQVTDSKGCDVAIASGQTLMNYGFLLPQTYQGNEKLDSTIMLLDNSAIIFKFKICEEVKL